MNNINLNNFDWEFYIYANKDLYKAGINNKLKAETHLKKYGIKENRIYKYDQDLDDFDDEIYMLFNNDISDDNRYFKPIYHWFVYGKNENRIYNIETAKKSMSDFNWIKYLYVNKDLIYQNIDTEKKAICHYIRHGKGENRIFSTNLNVPDKFDWEDYKIEKDLNKINSYNDAFIHFIENTNKNLIHPNVLKNVKNRFDIEYYKKFYDIENNLSKDDLIQDWIINGRFEKKYYLINLIKM